MPATMDWAWLGLLALVCTVYPYVTSVALMRRFSAFAMNLVINLEPVYGIILAYFIFPDTEKMTVTFYIGTSIILISVFAHPLIGKIQSKETSLGSIIQ
jgi:drug/metabolite transporter (DMT)-like permease